MTESNLPEIVNEFIEIRSLDITPYKIEPLKMSIEWTAKGEDNWQPLVPPHAFNITHPVWGSYIPSKVIPYNDKLHFVYYVNPDLPNQVRPFSEGECYVWVTEWSPDIELRYPAELRVFIDQVIMKTGEVKTVFITNREQWLLLTNQRDKEPPEAETYKGDLHVLP